MHSWKALLKKSALVAALVLLELGSAYAGAPIKDQYIVVLRGEQLTGTVARAAQALVGRVGGAEILFTYESALQGFAARLSPVQVDALRNNPLVKYIEQDQTMVLVDTQANPPSYGLDRIDQAALPLNQSYIYPHGAGGGAHVYDIDTGLRSTHVDFSGRVGAGRNFASNSTGILCVNLGINCAAPDPNNTSDCNGHGTHTAGTATGTSYGVAKSATIHSVRVFGCGNSTATSTIIAGVNWVTGNHASPAVANMSLGGGASQAMDDAVRAMINSGVTTAIAAGNDSGTDACTLSPARVTEGLVVGSTGTTDARSSFSNIGSCLDLFAPGENIISAGTASDTASASLSGTSMSTPHVAGAAARYLAANPGATPAQVQAALIGAATANVVGNPGAGSPNRLLFVNPNGP